MASRWDKKRREDGRAAEALAAEEAEESAFPLEIRLFGPMHVRLDGAPLAPLRTRKGLWLLALLTLRAQRQVARSWLAGTLWPESFESDAFANLRRSLYDLHRALGPQAHRLQSADAHTLQLDLAAAFVDMVAFDQAIVRGDTASLEQAVGLYRGPLLEGCWEEWALLERQAREQAYIRARETLAEQALSQE
ncbi:MAG TPA: hypothetical protein VKU00_26675, partial [Chthonomonadaceae bacterium]|nr:hypothetical protein [Chthonomonadaceae bacterium]